VGWENTKKTQIAVPPLLLDAKEEMKKTLRLAEIKNKKQMARKKLCSGFRMQSEVEYHRVEIKSWKTPH
jgi:hypothetical protein